MDVMVVASDSLTALSLEATLDLGEHALRLIGNLGFARPSDALWLTMCNASYRTL